MGDILQEKSCLFALRVANLSHFPNDKKRQYVVSRKIPDSGINIGLFIEEGKQVMAARILYKNIRWQSGKRLKQISC